MRSIIGSQGDEDVLNEYILSLIFQVPYGEFRNFDFVASDHLGGILCSVLLFLIGLLCPSGLGDVKLEGYLITLSIPQPPSNEHCTPFHRPILLSVFRRFVVRLVFGSINLGLRMEGFDSLVKKFHLHNAKNSLQNDMDLIDKDLERGTFSDGHPSQLGWI
ncbi:hypothetical protein Tco_0565210 [Tanacetum coccineum]